MPKGSLIIGVDLVPIKPLPHVIAFQADITTPKCRNELRQHMHDWKADLVLHDGAPNVGAAWVQDAFSQNELVLQSLRLATEFLVKGGNFVTKVFRSQDYNSLMWVFNQLFTHVEATKPPSSRNVSAEIFVVCRDFIAPKHIDPKFLDPKHVFKDLQSSLPASITEVPDEATASTSATMASTVKAANAAARLAATNNHAHANVYAPEKKRRQRDGYADGDYTLFHKASASDFVRGDPVAILGSMNKIAFETDEEKEWLKSRHTTPDIIANFEDLKVLGKGDFKALMKWRLAIRLEIGLDVKASKTDEATEDVEVEEMDEEQQISDELKRLHEEKRAKQKREKKRKNEIKTKTIQKLQLGMTAPTDLDMDDRELAGEEMFDLGEGERENRTGRSIEDAVRDADGMSESEASEASEEEDDDEVLSSDEERERRTAALEGTLDDLYDTYKERKSEQDAKWKVKQQRLKDRNYDAWHGIQEGSDSEDDGVDKGYRSGMVRAPRRGDADEEEEESEGEGGWDIVANQKAQDYDSDSDSDSDAEADTDAPKKKKAKVTIRDPRPVAPQQKKLLTSLSRDDSREKMSRQAQVWFDQGVFKDVGDLAALDGDDEEDEDEEMDEDDESDDDSVDSEGDVDMGSDESTLEAPEDEDDFEIVPQEVDEDPEWDVDDEDQDEVLQKKIKGELNLLCSPLTRRREGYSHCRGADAREPTREPRGDCIAADRRGLQQAEHAQQGRAAVVVPGRRVEALPAEHSDHEGGGAGAARPAARAGRAADQEDRRGQGPQEDEGGGAPRARQEEGRRRHGDRGPERRREGAPGQPPPAPRRRRREEAGAQGRCRPRRQQGRQGPPQGRQGQVQDCRRPHAQGGPRPEAHRKARQGQEEEVDCLEFRVCRPPHSIICTIMHFHGFWLLARANTNSRNVLATTTGYER